jgi:hypothetical protein
MTSPRQFVEPPIWTDDQFEERRRHAIADFINERAAEGSARYRAVFAANLRSVESLFSATDDLLRLVDGAALASTPSLIRAARYLGGPPISADDLDTLAESKIANRSRLDQDLARRAAMVIEAAIDPERFPWLFAAPRRTPTLHERDTAIRWTAGLQTVQEIQTGRRGESASRQERAVEAMLESLGFTRTPRRPIDITGGLAPGEFCREAVVVGTKCDVPVGLRDGRLLFIECKVSNSQTNSVKRLNRECGGKARAWREAFGDRAITAAVLAGVFKLKNLRDAQTGDHVAIFWEHDLAALATFIQAAI